MRKKLRPAPWYIEAPVELTLMWCVHHGHWAWSEMYWDILRNLKNRSVTQDQEYDGTPWLLQGRNQKYPVWPPAGEGRTSFQPSGSPPPTSVELSCWRHHHPYWYQRCLVREGKQGTTRTPKPYLQTLLHSFIPVFNTIDRNTSLLVDCPLHFPHATHHTHPYTTRFDDYAPARAGRRTPSTSRNTTLPRSSGKGIIAQTNLVFQVLEGAPQLVVPNPLGVLSPLLPLRLPHTQKIGDATFKKFGIDWNSICRALFNQNMAQTSWTHMDSSTHELLVCYSTLPQSLPHCLRQASDSTSGWVVLGSSSWGKPWHKSGSCQVTAACPHRVSLPSHEMTRKERSLSTQPRSSCKESTNSEPFCDLFGGVGSSSVSLLVVRTSITDADPLAATHQKMHKFS